MVSLECSQSLISASHSSFLWFMIKVYQLSAILEFVLCYCQMLCLGLIFQSYLGPIWLRRYIMLAVFICVSKVFGGSLILEQRFYFVAENNSVKLISYLFSCHIFVKKSFRPIHYFTQMTNISIQCVFTLTTCLVCFNYPRMNNFIQTNS